jgi:hypothetical protein
LLVGEEKRRGLCLLIACWRREEKRVVLADFLLEKRREEKRREEKRREEKRAVLADCLLEKRREGKGTGLCLLIACWKREEKRREEKRREEKRREEKRREERRAVHADCLFVLFWDLEDGTIISSQTLVNAYETHGSPHARRYCVLRKESETCVPTQVGEAVSTLCREFQVHDNEYAGGFHISHNIRRIECSVTKCCLFCLFHKDASLYTVSRSYVGYSYLTNTYMGNIQRNVLRNKISSCLTVWCFTFRVFAVCSDSDDSL